MNKPKPVAKVTHNHEHGSGNHFNIVWLQPGAMRAGMELYSEPGMAATAVPDGCAVINRTLTPAAWKRLCNADIWPVTPKSFQRMLDVLMEVAISNSPEFDGIKMVESHQIKSPDCRTCANRGRVDGLSQETHCEHCCHQPSIGLTSHYAPISESVLALNEADSSESAPEGMILMPMKADEHLVAEVRRLREENERLANDMSRCYRMLLSEPDVKGALFKAENILRESLADRGKK